MDNQRIYTFESGTVLRVMDGGYISIEELKAIEKAGDKLVSVKYKGKTVVVE